VVPRALTGRGLSGETISVHELWNRRHSTKFNGVAYPVQRAAAATYTESGKEEVRKRVAHYLGNAALIRSTLEELGFAVYGGINAPYVWLKTPRDLSSWDFFDLLLEKTHLVGTPGAGFGPAGEGYFRLSAFGSREDVGTAMERIRRHGPF
jgi:LL-diaminopimelate aminotransferase